MNKTILLAEDNRQQLDVLSRQLDRAGYQVLATADGDEAARLAQEALYHCAIFDLWLGNGVSGYQLIDIARDRDPHKPVIIITADRNEMAETMTVNAGINVFIQKPYRLKALLAWIESLTTSDNRMPPNILHFGQGSIDVWHNRVIPNKGDPFELPPKAFQVLAMMISRPSERFSYDSIIETVWGPDAVQRGAVHKAKSLIDRAFEEHGLEPVLKEIRNYGYEFTGKDC